MPFSDANADVVICSAVLHFARNFEHFVAMFNELWRVLRPGGMLFCRLASRIGMEFEPIRNGLYRVGSSEWFLVDEAILLALTMIAAPSWSIRSRLRLCREADA
jgi:ubiquinone/menaquinone biosynthesis C-methylase UbiE